MFKVSILDIKKTETIFEDLAHCCILPAAEGELSILDFHQPIIACLQEGAIKIDKTAPLAIKKGIARMQGNQLSILVER
ncbi:hypothetical protein ACFL1I_05225 [Candidatus Omnitrophota bacterium]